MDELITTTEAAEIAGVGVSSIKRWADQDLIRVLKTPGGHRRIDRADLLRFLRESQEDGGPLEDERRLSTPERRLSMSVNPIGSALVLPSELRDPENTDPHQLGRYWSSAMLQSDLFQLQALLLQARSRLGAWHAVADEVGLGLADLGCRWQSGEVTVAQEHIASGRLSQAMSAIANAIPARRQKGLALVACPPDEDHTLALSLVQLCLKEARWEALWVGASTPAEELCRIGASGEVDLIAVSASVISSDKEALSKLADDLGKACASSATALALGGDGAWPESPDYGVRFRSFGPFSTFIESLA